MKELISVEEAGQALGLATDTPLLGYYFKEDFLADNPGLAQSFHDATRDAKELLRRSDAAWEAIRPRMDADSETEFEQLRADWIAGIPARGPVDAAAADRMLELMSDLGGRELVGSVESVPSGLFADVR